MTTAERLYNTAKELPEPVVAEILDFAESLRISTQQLQATECFYSSITRMELLGSIHYAV